MELTVKYGTRDLSVIITRSRRKTLQIEVHPDMTIKVIAPENAEISQIEQRVIKRGRWILKQQAFFEQFLPGTPEREYVSGESHLYLGCKYLLKIRKSNKNIVKLIGGELIVFVKDIENKQSVKHSLTAWYYSHAKEKLEVAIKKYLTGYKQFNLQNPSLEIKRMPKRWGSCTPKGKILLNPELIKTPSKCIEYVVVHELCHLVHHSHSKDFYQLQKQIMPDWEKWKNRLETISS